MMPNAEKEKFFYFSKFGRGRKPEKTWNWGKMLLPVAKWVISYKRVNYSNPILGLMRGNPISLSIWTWLA